MNYPDYPESLREPLDFQEFKSLGQLLEKSENLYSDHVALINYGATITYRDVADLSQRLMMYFSKHNLKKGDRVALFMPNIIQFVIAASACLKYGLVVVNINPLYTARELAHVLQDAEPRMIIMLENFAHVLADIDENLHPEFIVLTELADCFPFIKRWVMNFVVRHIKKMIKPYRSFKKSIRWSELMSISDFSTIIRFDINQSDIAFLQYTGGTTGVPKGAILSHGNMIANVLQARSWVKSYFPDVSQYTVGTALPLYHIFSLTANFFTFYSLGSKNLLITNPRDLKEFIKHWKKYPIQALSGVNTLFNALLNHPDFDSIPIDKLKLSFGGGMAIQKVVAERWQQKTGMPIVQAYGLTEASPAVAINPLNQKEFNGSIGLPVPGTLVRIVNADGVDQIYGEIGELWVKGPQVMQGYWKNPVETAQVLTEDGWLKTGDMGYQREDGYIFLVDRKKEMIIVSGFNVYPSEIEDVLMKHSSIKEVAVIGDLDAHANEYVKAFCVLHDGQKLDPEDLQTFARKLLTAYKVPKVFIAVPELPKSPVGKILKKDLKSLYHDLMSHGTIDPHSSEHE